MNPCTPAQLQKAAGKLPHHTRALASIHSPGDGSVPSRVPSQLLICSLSFPLFLGVTEKHDIAPTAILHPEIQALLYPILQ